MITEESPATVGNPCAFVDGLHPWEKVQDGTYECRVLLLPESDGGYSVHCLRLPGVVSEGETVGEALANIGEAFRESVRCYRDSGEEIPWTDVELDRPKGSLERWILVNV